MPKRWRVSRCVMDMVSLGSPPENLTATSGKAFEVAPVQTRYRDLKRHGVTKVHAAVEAQDSNSLPSPQVMITIEKMVRAQVLAEQKKFTESKAWAFHVETYHHVVIRRLFQEWLKTRLGKDAKEKATEALKIAYGGDMTLINGDFVTESKTLLRHLQKAQEDGDTKAEKSISDKLEIIKKVAEKDLMPSSSGQGFLDILGAYGDANEAVHKCFSRTELQEICDEATSFTTLDGSAWLIRFSQDLLISSRRISD